VELDLDSEQSALADLMRSLLAPRGVADLDPEAGRWHDLAEAGLLGLASGGEARDSHAVELMVVMTELGRALSDEPYLDSAVLAAGIVSRVGTASQRSSLLDRIAGGIDIPVLAHAEGGRKHDAPISTRAEYADGGWRIHGQKGPVLHGPRATELLVTAIAEGALKCFLVELEAPGIRAEHYAPPFSIGRSQFTFAATPAALLGSLDVDHQSALEAAMVEACIAQCCEAVGILEEVFRLTLEHLKTRRQFNTPLSKFQSLAHRAADMYVQLELARSQSTLAVLRLDRDDAGEQAVAASRAALQVFNAARLIGTEAIQMHGGIGLTAEYPLGRYVARLTEMEQRFGDRDFHVGVLAAALDERDIPDVLA